MNKTMAGIFHQKDGNKRVLMADLAGTVIPFKHLSDEGVVDVLRVCLGLEARCKERGKAKGNDMEKLLTPEGMKWATEKAKALDKSYLVAEVGPDEESHEDELERLIREQEKDQLV